MATNAWRRICGWSIVRDTNSKGCIVCVHSYRRGRKTLLLRKLKSCSRDQGITSGSILQNARMDAANILVSIAFPDKELLIRWKKVIPLEQKYLYGIPVKTYLPRSCLSEKKEDMCAEHIEENIVSPEQVLTTPSTGSRRSLKRTYAVAGQQHNVLSIRKRLTTFR